jgi:hypothetical protein
MFAVNPVPDKIKKNLHKCNKITGRYIQNKYKILPFAIENNIYYFVETLEFLSIIKRLPIFLKVFK